MKVVNLTGFTVYIFLVIVVFSYLLGFCAYTLV
jgi:hypothetical protein